MLGSRGEHPVNKYPEGIFVSMCADMKTGPNRKDKVLVEGSFVDGPLTCRIGAPAFELDRMVLSATCGDDGHWSPADGEEASVDRGNYSVMICKGSAETKVGWKHVSWPEHPDNVLLVEALPGHTIVDFCVEDVWTTWVDVATHRVGPDNINEKENLDWIPVSFEG